MQSPEQELMSTLRERSISVSDWKCPPSVKLMSKTALKLNCDRSMGEEMGSHVKVLRLMAQV